jgi:hypothetical protein
MKALDYNIKKRKEEEKTTENHTEKICETHLTASGVCTTIRPENSGM